MKKRVTALLLVITLLCTVTGFASYYPEDVTRADIHFSEMLKQEFDFEGAIEKLQKVDKLIDDGGKTDEILKLFDEALPSDAIDFLTRCTLDFLIASMDNSEENNAKLTKVESTAIDIHNLTTGITRKLFENPVHKDKFVEFMEMSEEELQEIIDSIPSDEEYAAEKALIALSERYYNSIFGSYEMEYNGKKYTFATLGEIPTEDCEAQYKRYLSESCDELTEIFIDVVKTRVDLSKALGYESYVDFAYTEEYPKDYTDDDLKNFYELTAKYFVPLYKKLDEATKVFEGDDVVPEITLSIEEIIEEFRGSLEKINPELTIGYDYMLKYGLYDIGHSDKKRPGGFTIGLEYFGVPFLFDNAEGYQDYLFSTLIHEYGHFNAMFHSPGPGSEVNIDVAEIHSQSLETLMLPEYGRYYGNDAVFFRYSKLMSLLDSVIAASVYSMWLEEVYETENLTREILCSKYREVCETLGVEDIYLTTGLDCEWMTIPHNFEQPFYYISYGVSALATLELFSDMIKDRSGAIDRYMKLSAKGPAVMFSETLEECGFSNIFAESTCDKICKAIEEYAGLGFSDVKADDWFYPYVIKSAYFLDGTADKFSPNEPATRLTFVEALGRIEEDINGISSKKADFKDTDSKYVSWAKDEGITAGISETEFGSDASVTREMVVSFLYRLAGSPAVSSKSTFSDSGDISTWAEDAVAWAENSGIVNGYEDNTFRPKKSVTLGEVAKLIADTYKINY